jgi:high frequency lysogenization protein
MNEDINKITYAFSALVESLYQISSIGHSGTINKTAVDYLLKGVLKTESVTSTSIYPLEQLKNGLSFFSDSSNMDSTALKEINYYIPSILKLTSVYTSNNELRDSLSRQILHIKETLSHQENKSLFVGKHIANWYTANISEPELFAMQIFGSKESLSKDANLIFIRALIISAMRACILWRQLGGTQLNLIFNRSKMAICAKRMLEVI